MKVGTIIDSPLFSRSHVLNTLQLIIFFCVSDRSLKDSKEQADSVILLNWTQSLSALIQRSFVFICFLFFWHSPVCSPCIRIHFLYVFSCGNVLARPFTNKDIRSLYISRQPPTLVDEDDHLLAKLIPQLVRGRTIIAWKITIDHQNHWNDR